MSTYCRLSAWFEILNCYTTLGRSLPYEHYIIYSLLIYYSLYHYISRTIEEYNISNERCLV